MGEPRGILVIRVLPLDQAGPGLKLDSRPAGQDPLAWASPRRRFTASGRAGLDAILNRLALTPADEVLITNTSGQLWISACVSSIVFNHAQPSRVLTDDTRAIVVIHEFGYPHPRLQELVGIARERGIPLIEDCAHSLDSTSPDATPLGALGDFAIFSLSKVAPVSSGGVLVLPPDNAPWAAGLDLDFPESDAQVETIYQEQLPALATYTQLRRRNAQAIRDAFPDVPLMMEPTAGVTPWYVAMLTGEATAIRRRSAVIEWGSTLDQNLLLVTTNPFVEAQRLTAALAAAFADPVPA